MLKLGTSALIAVAIASLISGSAIAASTITIKIGGSVGAIHDLAGRLIGRHLGKFLPGNPEILIDNVNGGGGLVVARQIESSEPADGSVLGLTNSGLIGTSVLTPDKAPFHADKVSWLGSMGPVPTICAVTKASGINSIADLVTSGAKMGSSGNGSKLYVLPEVIKHLYNGNLQVIEGFNGVGEIHLAMERGEIDGICGVSLNTFIGSGFAETSKVIGTFADDLVYDGAPVPQILPADASEADKKAVALLVKDDQVFAPLFMPGATDPAIVAEYRAAFEKMLADPEFQADAEQIIHNVHPTNGETVEAVVKDVIASDPATIARARELAE